MNIGIIGTGWGARVQLPAFREEGHDVRAIYGRDSAKTERIARGANLAPYASWRELIDCEDIELVSIVTPPNQHAEITLAALRAGKHVICEKPTARNAAEAQSMLDAAKEHPAQLSIIDHELRFLPTWLAARDMVSDLGGVRLVEVRFCSPSRGDRARGWNWWSDAEAGGGVLGAVGSHFIDAVRYLVGEVTSVRASLATVIKSRPDQNSSREVTSDDVASVELRTSDGAHALLSLSVVSSADEPTTLTIHGERGGLRLIGRELWRSDGKQFELAMPDRESDREGDSAGGPFGTATRYLARSLAQMPQGRATLPNAATFADGLRQQKTLDAARASSKRDGGWVAID